MKEITKKDPNYKKIEAFLKSRSSYYGGKIEIDEIFEVREGGFIVNGHKINSSSKKPNYIFYHLGTDSSGENLYAKTENREAVFLPLTESIGEKEFRSEYASWLLPKALYSLKQQGPYELFPYSKIEEFKYVPGKGFKVARVTISIYSNRELVFLINEDGERVSPICDTKIAYSEGNIANSYVEPKAHQTLERFIEEVADEERVLSKVVEAAKDYLDEKAYALK